MTHNQRRVGTHTSIEQAPMGGPIEIFIWLFLACYNWNCIEGLSGKWCQSHTDPFLSHSILPFLDCPSIRTYGQCQCYLVAVAAPQVQKYRAKMAAVNHPINIYTSDSVINITLMFKRRKKMPHFFFLFFATLEQWANRQTFDQWARRVKHGRGNRVEKREVGVLFHMYFHHFTTQQIKFVHILINF